MFTALEVDVTDLLQEENELRIDFRSAVRVGNERRAAFLAANPDVPEAVERMDDRSFVRKAQYMYGWDWGPRLVSCGIWQAVELLEFAARLVDVHVVRTPDGEGGWDLTIASRVEGDGVALHTMLDWEAEPFLAPDGGLRHRGRGGGRGRRDPVDARRSRDEPTGVGHRRRGDGPRAKDHRHHRGCRRGRGLDGGFDDPGRRHPTRTARRG